MKYIIRLLENEKLKIKFTLDSCITEGAGRFKAKEQKRLNKLDKAIDLLKQSHK